MTDIEDCLQAAKAAASEAQHQADLAAAESNRLNADKLILRSPQPESSELQLIGTAQIADIEGMGLMELSQFIEFPAYECSYKLQKQFTCPHGNGQLEFRPSGFTYTEPARGNQERIRICYTHDTIPARVSIERGEPCFSLSDRRKNLAEYIGTEWEGPLLRLLTEAWIRRHTTMARMLADNDHQESLGREQIVLG